MSSKTADILVPLLGDQSISRASRESFLSQEGFDYRVWIFSERAADGEVPDNVHWIEGSWLHFASLLNEAARGMTAPMILVVPPDAVLVRYCLSAFGEVLAKNPSVGYAYSDYRYSDGREIRLIDDPGDITERQDWGRVFAVRRQMLLRKGGVDEDNPLAALYDLRLKLSDDAVLLHVPEVLYEVPTPLPPSEDVGEDVLFFPGQGQYGGFSYLFNDPDVEGQFERVFYQMLKRRGAFLERIPAVTPPDLGPLPSPAVSVVVPVYNRQDYIGSAIESVLRGTFADFELLVIDNGSTDGTCEEVEKYASDSRIHLLHCPENIIAKSLNMGIKASKGRYVAQLDSDDEYTANTLAAMVEYLEGHPEAGLAISYYELMDMDGNALKDFGIVTHSEYNRNNILRVDGAGAVRVWRKSALKNLGGFDEKELRGYGEDYDLVLKVSEHYEVGRVHEVLYRYRRHPGNTDALIDGYRKIRAKSLARQNAMRRRRQLNFEMRKT